jgi:hypothetical protein
MESPNDIYPNSTKGINEKTTFQLFKENEKIFLVNNQVECLIQHQYSIFVPAIVLKYKLENTNEPKEKEFYGWDYNDLLDFIKNFGEIENLEISSNVAIVLFKTFMDAYTSKEYLQNSNNFKDSEKNNFHVDWYRREDEVYISEIFKEKIRRVSPATILDTIQENSNLLLFNKINKKL